MSWSDNLPVYFDNLSGAYTVSVLIAVFALFVAHYYQSHDTEEQKQNSKKKGSDSESDDDSTAEENESPYVKGEFGGALGKIKAAKQDASLKLLQGEETEETKIIEKKTEAEQLKAIWDLLQEQEEKFKIGSKKELEEQLRLYRR